MPDADKPGVSWLAVILLIPVLVTILFSYMAWEAGNPRITILEIPGAPEGIAFIADPHVKSGNIDAIRNVIGEINHLDPSIVLIGGDFISHDTSEIDLNVVWGEIEAPTYAILGNHDYRVGIKGTGLEGGMAWMMESILRSNGYDASDLYSDPDLATPDLVEAVLEKNGITVLRNECIPIDIDRDQFILCGLDDVWACRTNSPAIPDSRGYILYLVHEPFYQEDWNADLILSGHTHGGQFKNTAFFFLDQTGLVNLKGISKKGGTMLYVTSGVGTSRSNRDYRWFTPPEIVVINPRNTTQTSPSNYYSKSGFPV